MTIAIPKFHRFAKEGKESESDLPQHNHDACILRNFHRSKLLLSATEK